jgi:beta-lactamase class D
MKYTIWGLIIGIFLVIPLCQAGQRQDPGLANILQLAGVEGCIVLLEIQHDLTWVSDESRCQERFVPASTFKVVNALIAMETGVVQDDEVFHWNGSSHFLKSWEKDMTIKEAIAVSAVPVFQEIARRIGQQRMANWVTKIGYGNADIGENIDRFWLDGPLSISPIEQAKFMARLSMGQLPFSERSLAGLRSIIPNKHVDKAHVFGKTGWASSAKPRVGWYVGWIENKGKPVAFAVNIVMESLTMAPLRESLAVTALRYSGVLNTKETTPSTSDRP